MRSYPQVSGGENIACDLNDTAWFDNIDASGARYSSQPVYSIIFLRIR